MTESAFESFVRITAVKQDEPIETRDVYVADYVGSAILEELYEQAEKFGADFENDGVILTMRGTFDLSGIVNAALKEMKSLAEMIAKGHPVA